MKKTLFNKDTLINKYGEFIGYNLGFDFASEHEHGIAGIRQSFGIKQTHQNVFVRFVNRMLDNESNYGISARTIKTKQEMFKLERDGLFTLSFHSNPKPYVDDCIKLMKWPGRKEDFFAYWDEDGFIFTTKVKEHFDALVKAFDELDVAFYLGSRSFLSSGGLHIVIASKVDEEVDQLMIQQDKNAEALGKAADETKIEKDLIDAGKKFYALSPGWKNDEQTEVWFWLNPQDRSLNAGWYTVEELKLWIDNKGPVVEKKKEEPTTKKDEEPPIQKDYTF